MGGDLLMPMVQPGQMLSLIHISKMKPFIFGERNNIYILDLKQTIVEADKAYTFLKDCLLYTSRCV